MKIIRHISPSGFIDSLSIEMDGVEPDNAEVVIGMLNATALHFQAVTPVTYKPHSKAETPPAPAVAAAPPGRTEGQPPAPSAPRTGQVVNVYPQNDNPNGPLVLQFADGSKATTFDKKASALVGQTITYGTVTKTGTKGGTFTNIQWFRPAQPEQF